MLISDQSIAKNILGCKMTRLSNYYINPKQAGFCKVVSKVTRREQYSLKMSYYTSKLLNQTTKCLNSKHLVDSYQTEIKKNFGHILLCKSRYVV